jgi:hypothetical protein
MTNISFVAQLTAVSSWLTSGHQSCCSKGCTPRPSRYPTRKSLVGLNLAIVGGTQYISASYPSVGKSVVKISPDITMVMWRCPVLLIPHVLISTQLTDGGNSGYLKHDEVRSTSYCSFKEERSHNTPIWHTTPDWKLWWSQCHVDTNVHTFRRPVHTIMSVQGTIQLKCHLISPNSCSLLSTMPQS